jgi:hypothetical protein
VGNHLDKVLKRVSDICAVEEEKKKKQIKIKENISLASSEGKEKN